MQMHFYQNGEPINSVIKDDKLKETSDYMYKLLLAIGIVVMFIWGTFIGIQFIVASAEDKAKMKEALIPYIAGCIVIFGAFTIWSIVVNIGQDITVTSGVNHSLVDCQSCGNKGTLGTECLYCGEII